MKMLTALACTIALLGGMTLAKADAPCCEKATKAGKECTHKCCVDAKKDGKECEKCSKPKSK